jgi:RNA polymerase sigma-70 factor (ECF subfamily)
VDRHKDALVNYLLRLTRSRERAEEHAQEAFLRLYESASRYKEQGHLVAYLYRIATNLVRSEERRERRWQFLSSAFFSNGHRPLPTPQTQLLQQEVKEKVYSALQELPATYRAPLVLRDIEGWSYQDIAKILGCREGTVKSRINRGRSQLREILEPFWSRGER